ncbi:hypothetical protein DFO62_1371 [Serratia fonticola]|nr:hypothetical protein DFO62_1371 [Serratia fonticola]
MYDWNDFIAVLGDRLDVEIENENIPQIEKSISELIELVESSDIPDPVKCVFLYFIFNLQQTKANIGPFEEKHTNYNAAIIAFKRLRGYPQSDCQYVIDKASTNAAILLGNKFGRVYEAIALWSKCLESDKESGIVANHALATSLIETSFLFESDELIYFYQLYAFKCISRLLSYSNLQKDNPEIYKSVQQDSSHFLRKFYDHAKNNIDKNENLQNYSASRKMKKSEEKYRKWSAENVLFLNPLNDLSNSDYVFNDMLSFPSYTVSLSVGPYLSAAFSAMCNEFCFYRFMYYESLNNLHPKYIDKEKLLINTLDSVCYDAACEKLKCAIRGCFSLLDKLIALLHNYMNLEGQPSFTPNWFKRTKLNQTDNKYISALYCLSKDFSPHENKTDRPSFWNEPNLKEIREVRNHLEHGWVRVIEFEELSEPIWESTHDYAYTITKESLLQKGLTVLQQTRNAIMYLQLAVSLNESTNKDDSKIIMPIETPIWHKI